MEALHVTMDVAKEKGIFDGVKLPEDGPISISHLFFADDALFLEKNQLEMSQILVIF